MGETSIEWCDYTFNPWIGCAKVSAGCTNCYAEKDTYSRVSKSRGLPLWGPTAERHRTSKANWRKPMAWDKATRLRRFDLWKAGKTSEHKRPKVFCASLADIFEDHPSLPEWRADLWSLIEACDALDWLLLTKRPENVLNMVPGSWLREGLMSAGFGWPSHVSVGTSVENDEAARGRIPHLLRIPAAVRFLSCEPLLGSLDLDPWLRCERCGYTRKDAQVDGDHHLCAGTIPSGLDWVIVGGESGPKARPMHPDWARSIRDQCQAAGVPFFFKQHGEWTPRWRDDGQPFNSLASHNRDRLVSLDGMVHCTKEAAGEGYAPMSRIGKKAAGRLLDGRTWDEMPEPRP